MTRESEPRGGDQCTSCGKRLTVNDKARNRGTGLCWECFQMSPEARAAGLKEAGAEAGVSKVTTMATADVLRSATDFVLARGRWQVLHQTEDQLTLQNFAGGSCLLALLLALLAILPAVLYLLLAKGESRLIVRASPVGSVTRVSISWLGTNWRALASEFLMTLPDASEEQLAKVQEAEAAQPAQAKPETVESEEREKVFEQIRELARLRDDGLITEEEFETKKADLLSRL